MEEKFKNHIIFLKKERIAKVQREWDECLAFWNKVTLYSSKYERPHCSSLKISMTPENNFYQPSPNIIALHELKRALATNDHSQIISLVNSLHSPSLLFHAFFSSICLKDDQLEYEISKNIKSRKFTEFPPFIVYHSALEFKNKSASYPSLNLALLDSFHLFPIPQTLEKSSTSDSYFESRINQKKELPALHYLSENPETFLELYCKFTETPKSKIRIKSRKSISDQVKESISTKNWYTSLALINEAIKKSPQSSELYLDRAFVFYNLKALPEAIEDCSRSLAINESDRGFFMRGVFKCLFHDHSGFQEDFKNLKMLPFAISDISEINPDLLNFQDIFSSFPS